MAQHHLFDESWIYILPNLQLAVLAEYYPGALAQRFLCPDRQSKTISAKKDAEKGF
jgi:hypothetical protein